MALEFIQSAKLPTQWAEFTISGFKDKETGKEHIALSLGDIKNGEPVLVPDMHDLRWTAPEIVSKIASLGESGACGQIITTGALTGGTFYEL